MRILIYGLNYAPEPTGVGKYTGEMAEWLQGRGHQVRVVTAPPYYPAWKVGAEYSGWRYRRESLKGIEVFRCPLWVPKNPDGPARVLHLLSFAISSVPAMLRQISWNPDVVFIVEPTFFCSPCALLTARWANARAFLHIQDHEVEAFFGLGFTAGSRVRRFVTGVEGWLMRRFDHVSTISEEMVERISGFGIPAAQTSVFPNWVDTARVRPGVDGRDYRVEWGLEQGKKIVLYAGGMGRKQGLGMVLETAGALEKEYPDVMFLLVGEGSARAHLVEQAERHGLRNVMFRPPQPPEDFPSLLSLADVHLVVQRRGAAGAVLPSKLTGILAAGGTALITADEDTGLGRLVADNPGIAILVPPEDPLRFREALRAALSTDRSDGGWNRVARNYAERYLATVVVLSRMEEMLSAETETGIEGIGKAGKC